MSKWENITHNHQDVNVIGMINKLWSTKRFGYSLPPDIYRHSADREQIHYLLSKIGSKIDPNAKIIVKAESRAITKYEKLFDQFEDVKLKIKNEPIFKYISHKKQERLKLKQLREKVIMLEKQQEKATE